LRGPSLPIHDCCRLAPNPSNRQSLPIVTAVSTVTRLTLHSLIALVRLAVSIFALPVRTQRPVSERLNVIQIPHSPVKSPEGSAGPPGWGMEGQNCNQVGCCPIDYIGENGQDWSRSGYPRYCRDKNPMSIAHRNFPRLCKQKATYICHDSKCYTDLLPFSLHGYLLALHFKVGYLV